MEREANQSRVGAGAGLALAALLAVGVAGTGAPAAMATGGATPPTSAMDTYLREQLAASSIPGMAVVVVRDGEPTYEAALGTAIDGSPMTLSTPLIIGSVGKSMTALAIAQLGEAGRIELAAPVTRYLPWFALAAPDAEVHRITVGSLLAHTSGLSTADGQDARWYEPGLTPEGVARGLATVSPDRPVGTYEYSNLNYVLLGVVVEAVSGLPYGEYLARHVFEPLDMRATSASPVGATGDPTGHRYLFGIPVAFGEPYPTGMVPAGYQVSTAEDMARFAGALASGGTYRGVDVRTGLAASGPGPSLGTNWQPLGPVGPGTASGQSGSTLATNADILVQPASRRAVVVLLDANPTQLLGMPRGAADIALDLLRLSDGQDPAAGPPTVRSVYLVVDVLLLVLALLLVVHAWRARTWGRRWRGGTGHRRLLARTVAADLVLPLAILVAIPMAIGATGSTHAGDVLGGWRFMLWTLPDVAIALLALACVPLAIGAGKVVMARPAGRPPAGTRDVGSDRAGAPETTVSSRSAGPAQHVSTTSVR